MTQKPAAGSSVGIDAALLAVVDRAGIERRLPTAGATLISHSSNAVYLLPEVPAVARVTSGPGGTDRVVRTQAITAWLVDRGFGATAPLPGVDVVDIDDRTSVSFWAFYPQADHQPPATSSDLGRLLRDLHDLDVEHDKPPVDVPVWLPLESLADTVSDPEQSVVLADIERTWLLRRIREIRDQLSAEHWPLGRGLIHGDAWAGNLLWDAAAQRMLLGDWDWVSYGPREIDLIPTWHAAIRYGRTEAWTRAFVDQYGYDLATTSAYDVLVQMRDLVQLAGPIRRAPHSPAAADRLAQRLGDLRRGIRSSSWLSR